jgi:hypothetical protein
MVMLSLKTEFTPLLSGGGLNATYKFVQVIVQTSITEQWSHGEAEPQD